jgi:hypothetical protein
LKEFILGGHSLGRANKRKEQGAEVLARRKEREERLEVPYHNIGGGKGGDLPVTF